jgi:hypothetical protein
MKSMYNSHRDMATQKGNTISFMQDTFCFLSFRKWMIGFLKLARNHAPSSCSWGAAVSPMLPSQLVHAPGFAGQNGDIQHDLMMPHIL